jgi:diketogulonate reductase-like aldo/keto reductase
MSDQTDDVRVLKGNGDTMPALGFGTWQLDGRECVEGLQVALDAGYTHIDTAQAYENEEQVGEGIEQSGVDREEIFLTTKVWRDNLAAADLKDSVEGSLRKLRTEYVDLLLIHWPGDSVPVGETLGAMADLREAGKVRNVGVSNFTTELLEEAQEASEVPIFCNQVEYHVYLSQEPVLEWCRENGTLVVAYSPLARAKVFEDPSLQEIGKRYGKNAGQVALRWLLQQKGVGAIPKSGNPGHIQSNFEVFDFELSEEEIAKISGLECGGRLIDPGFAPDWD